MKTTISIPNELFEAAELVAKRLGLSRRAGILDGMGVRAYIARSLKPGEQGAIYAPDPGPESHLRRLVPR